jgi:hypothetical protein
VSTVEDELVKISPLTFYALCVFIVRFVAVRYDKQRFGNGTDSFLVEQKVYTRAGAISISWSNIGALFVLVTSDQGFSVNQIVFYGGYSRIEIETFAPVCTCLCRRSSICRVTNLDLGTGSGSPLFSYISTMRVRLLVSNQL